MYIDLEFRNIDTAYGELIHLFAVVKVGAGLQSDEKASQVIDIYGIDFVVGIHIGCLSVDVYGLSDKVASYGVYIKRVYFLVA